MEQLERSTGARVELGNFHFGWRLLSARFDGLTLHGREPAGTPPLFHAERLAVRHPRRIVLGPENFARKRRDVSFLGARASGKRRLDERSGTKDPRSAGKPDVQSLFDLKIAQLRLEDGEILWNDTRIPLQAKGGNFEFAMNYASEGGRPVYLGQTSWQKFEVAALRNLPFVSNFSARFTLRQDSFSVTQLQWKTAAQRNRRAGQSCQFRAARLDLPVPRPAAPRRSLDDRAPARCAGRAY